MGVTQVAVRMPVSEEAGGATGGEEDEAKVKPQVWKVNQDKVVWYSEEERPKKTDDGETKKEVWQLVYVDPSWCAVPLEATGGKTLCKRAAQEQFLGTCSRRHMRTDRLLLKVRADIHIVSNLEGFNRRRDLHDHANHYVCHPCSVMCHSCGRGVLVTSVRHHVPKCEAKVEGLRFFDNPFKTKAEAYHVRDDSLAELETRSQRTAQLRRGC